MNLLMLKKPNNEANLNKININCNYYYKDVYSKIFKQVN